MVSYQRHQLNCRTKNRIKNNARLFEIYQSSLKRQNLKLICSLSPLHLQKLQIAMFVLKNTSQKLFVFEAVFLIWLASQLRSAKATSSTEPTTIQSSPTSSSPNSQSQSGQTITSTTTQPGRSDKKEQKQEHQEQNIKSQGENQAQKQNNDQKSVFPVDQPIRLNANGKQVNIANYTNEAYAQAAIGDNNTNCLNFLDLCSNDAYRDLMHKECAGTCAREVNGQDHGQNCREMADLCTNQIYKDLLDVYCKSTCH